MYYIDFIVSCNLQPYVYRDVPTPTRKIKNLSSITNKMPSVTRRPVPRYARFSNNTGPYKAFVLGLRSVQRHDVIEGRFNSRTITSHGFRAS